jgi:glycosyltransferase involved in cell wall biosynthesis
MNTKGVSIIICFFNPGDKLIPTLSHVQELVQVEGYPVELILVDNASTDDSKSMICRLLEGNETLDWKIIDAPEPGLAHARMVGAAVARYAFWLFCDDDNWLSKAYLEIGIQVLESRKSIGILGGLGVPVSSVDIPEWFSEVAGMYATGVQRKGGSGRVKGERNMVYGAGMWVRAEAWNHLFRNGFSFFATGRKGNSLSSSEDSELCLAMQVSGYEIYYEETLRFEHFIAPERLTDSYKNRLRKGIIGSGFIARFYLDYLQGYVPPVRRFFWLREAIRVFLDLMRGLIHGRSVYRELGLLKFLLLNRSYYDAQVLKVVETCIALQKNKALRNG